MVSTNDKPRPRAVYFPDDRPCEWIRCLCEKCGRTPAAPFKMPLEIDAQRIVACRESEHDVALTLSSGGAEEVWTVYGTQPAQPTPLPSRSVA